jgi:uncharacterized protein (TIGR00369 family)
MNKPVMSIDDLHGFLATSFPQVIDKVEVLHVEPMGLSVNWKVDEQDLRPGGTVSGPTMFALADVSFYLATLAMIGPEALTVTTHCSINFMRKPEPKNIWGDARILKLGKSLAVGDVLIYSEGMPDPVAHAQLSYSIPPRKSAEVVKLR